MDDKARIAELQATIERLSEENAALLEQLMELKPAPVEWRLTATEARIVACLARRASASKAQLMLALYAGRIEDEPDIKIIDVYVHKVRRKLEPWGITIKTNWGQGYFFDEETRARVRKDMGLA